jgi:hypothetical protein
MAFPSLSVPWQHPEFFIGLHVREESFNGQTYRIGYGLFSRHEAMEKL